MILLLTLSGFVLAVLLTAVFSGGETGVYRLSRVRLKVRAEHGDRRARLVERVVADAQSALALTLLGTNLAEYAATVCFAVLLSVQFGLAENESQIYTTLLVTLIVFVFGEVVPKASFQSHPDRLMFAVGPILYLAKVVLYPAVWVLRRVTTQFAALFGSSAGIKDALDPREQMARLLREGIPPSDHDEAHHDMVDRVLMLAEMPIHTVMTPRNRVVSIAATAGPENLLALARTRRHSVLPVFGRHPRRIEGIVEVHKLLDDDTWRSVGERMVPCTRLGPHDSVAAALLRLQREQSRMALVTDRGGYLLGIVTLKDLLEELVGELPAW